MRTAIAVLLILLPVLAFAVEDGEGPVFNVVYHAKNAAGPLDGRLLLLISNDDSREPRFQISDNASTQLVFGMDLEGWKPNQAIKFDAGAFGYPLASLRELPPGDYNIQILLHRYETFHRADGHVVKLPMDRGEGQHWNRAPGNLLSTPVKLHVDASATINILLDRIIPPIEPPQDTKYIKHVKIESELLTKFWGRPMQLGAILLLPEGYDEHPDARYPLVINHGHFPFTFREFDESPIDPILQGRARQRAEAARRFYKTWTGPDFPRVVIMLVQHANPYYDDSYAVNSVNVGPYGDAIVHELIPQVEKQFRCIGQPWARTMYGGSTGGWIVLAQQIFYPDDFNGAWASCPDPVDFRAYQIVNIYDHANAYRLDSQWKDTQRPGARNYLGEMLSTMAEQNHRELALGTLGRSGGQWDIWQAVYSPVGPEGYPAPIWDKRTGEIDHEVAAYWREHYDLRYILQRDWKILGPKLVGKIRIWTGDMDTFHLNNAVYLLEEFLESTKEPYYGGEVHYGDRKEHCWSGDSIDPDTGEYLGYHERFIPMMVEHMLKTAPSGADVTSWHY